MDPTLHWDFIPRPHCSECGTMMWLFGIEADPSGYELQSFECPKCNHLQVAIAIGSAAEPNATRCH